MSMNNLHPTTIQIMPSIVRRLHYGTRVAQSCRQCKKSCIVKDHYRSFKLHKNGKPIAYYINVANLIYENDYMSEADIILQNCDRLSLTQCLWRPVQLDQLPLVIKVELRQIANASMKNQLNVLRRYFVDKGQKVRFDVY